MNRKPNRPFEAQSILSMVFFFSSVLPFAFNWMLVLLFDFHMVFLPYTQTQNASMDLLSFINCNECKMCLCTTATTSLNKGREKRQHSMHETWKSIWKMQPTIFVLNLNKYFQCIWLTSKKMKFSQMTERHFNHFKMKHSTLD